MMHIADCIDMDERTDAGYKEEHHGSQPVDIEADMRVEMTGR